ncbi:MAG: DNA-directed RNA polymerase subunit P [Candidatus Nanoarchaeia archaeon]|nr:DNA-directed RNA polymerase subunit P [Candidatus Haiyanarchaeum thermophilum]MCW1302892.1 DNA-directed RNA polymerase subunit P [Candidatus Haiyanarchaeum thermophilum]MCW1303571.1 DNA-directed RNA polymerase subunit P [Candidatus Haiyanarchaeum thermophilum]MCW1306253.1 DNA-directed RNA polymerase subunit P [Candidatus Haiyanarchaeum thermophilum]MCW1307511.1 DNA-directed RNA polymerase subunit P [Candidatus Haiyanarchaeum thermophilum]
MTKYICFYCHREISWKEVEKIRCPYCGGKVFFKARPKIVKRIKAI